LIIETIFTPIPSVSKKAAASNTGIKVKSPITANTTVFPPATSCNNTAPSIKPFSVWAKVLRIGKGKDKLEITNITGDGWEVLQGVFKIEANN